MKTDNDATSISLEQFSKWAKVRVKDLDKALKGLEKAEADLEAVVKEHLDKANWRGLRNRINKLKRELPTAGKFKQALKKEIAFEAKRFNKLLEHAKSR